MALCWKEKLLPGGLVVTCRASWLLTLLCGPLSTGATYFDAQIIPDLSVFVMSHHFFQALPYHWAQQHVSGIFCNFSRQSWFRSVWKWYLETMIWELGVIIAFGVSLCLGLSADRARGERSGIYRSS